MPRIQPIQPSFHLKVLTTDQLEEIKAATLHVMEHVGVQFPSERALRVFAEHGALVDMETQIVRLPPDMVSKAMKHAPRSYTLSGRAEGTDLLLDGTRSYFSTDGCAIQTVDFETRELRASCKDDVGKMARVIDYLSSVSFYWPMVSAQDYGVLAPLHELDASFNNTVKHIQSETVMGAKPAQYALRMAEVIAGSAEKMRAKPPLSLMVCTISPLGHDKDGIEGAMVFAEAGIPVGFMTMPHMGATAPATTSGALVVGSAEVVAAMVLVQLVAPGAPTFYSIVLSTMHPRTGLCIWTSTENYLSYVAGVQIAHHWGVPILGGAFGTQHIDDVHRQTRDIAYASLMVPLAGADFVVAMGGNNVSSILLPEQIIFDDETYHTVRKIAEGIDSSASSLALDVIADVGPRGHYLAQKHTRKSVREMWFSELSYPPPPPEDQPLPDVQERAEAILKRILKEHQPEPLEKAAQTELQVILKSAERDFG